MSRPAEGGGALSRPAEGGGALRRSRRPAASPDVVLLRLAPVAASAAVAGALLAAHPTQLAALLAGGCLAAAAGAGLLPDTWVPTLALLAILALYANVTGVASFWVRGAAAVPLAALLWGIHVLYALGASVPLRARLDRGLLRLWGRRGAPTIACSAPLVVAAVVLGSVSPHDAWLRALGVASALAVAVAPLLAGGGKLASRRCRPPS